MKSITIPWQPGPPVEAAHKAAIEAGFNCYSKPWGPGAPQDFTADREAVFYFSRNLEVLEVVVRTTQADPLQEPEANQIVSNQTEIIYDQV